MDEDRLGEAKSLASRIVALAAEVSDRQAPHNQQDWEVNRKGPWSLDAIDELAGNWRGYGPLAETVDALDRVLEGAGLDAELLPTGGSDFFSLGSVSIYGEPQQIHLGFIQRVLRLPLLTRLPNRVVAFLTNIPGSDEWLKRENHSNLGYHYHYLNAKKERSDVALCWDTRAGEKTPQPLFQEKHGESHSRFSGRPDLWGDTKRQSIHKACVKDLKRWSLDKFRMACDKAGPVWPLGAELTARPAEREIAPRSLSKKGQRNRC